MSVYHDEYCFFDCQCRCLPPCVAAVTLEQAGSHAFPPSRAITGSPFQESPTCDPSAFVGSIFADECFGRELRVVSDIAESCVVGTKSVGACGLSWIAEDEPDSEIHSLERRCSSFSELSEVSGGNARDGGRSGGVVVGDGGDVAVTSESNVSIVNSGEGGGGCVAAVNVGPKSKRARGTASRARAYVFTCNNPVAEDQRCLSGLVSSGFASYLTYGSEVAPSTSTPHYQGFVYFRDAVSFTAACKRLGRCHVEACKDDPKDGYRRAIEYCQKDHEFVEFGVRPVGVLGGAEKVQENWDEYVEYAKAGKLDLIPSSMFVRHYNVWKSIRKDFMSPPLDAPHVTGVWVQGPAGCGKSRFVRDLVGLDFYRKMRNAWWDGYQMQKFAICDDLDKFDIKLGGLIKDWTDRYSFTCESKGGAHSIRPTLVFFTSQYRIEDIWQDTETIDAIKRRCFILDLFSPIALGFKTSMELIIESLMSRNKD